ncbi:MAG: transaldolase family protein [Pleomorphochaeta sp.]
MMTNLILDSANLKEIKMGLNYYPLLGITTNPSLLSKEIENKNLMKHLYEIKKCLNKDQQLHIQTTQTESDKIIKQAIKINEAFGENTFVKIPSTREGIKAIRSLEGRVNITATLIYTPLQGIIAAMSGARYLAFYYNRMENNSINVNDSFNMVSDYLSRNNFNCDILAASFKNVSQVFNSFKYGAKIVTVPFSILDEVFYNPIISEGETKFLNDWKNSKLKSDWI